MLDRSKEMVSRRRIRDKLYLICEQTKIFTGSHAQLDLADCVKLRAHVSSRHVSDLSWPAAKISNESY